MTVEEIVGLVIGLIIAGLVVALVIAYFNKWLPEIIKMEESEISKRNQKLRAEVRTKGKLIRALNEEIFICEMKIDELQKELESLKNQLAEKNEKITELAVKIFEVENEKN